MSHVTSLSGGTSSYNPILSLFTLAGMCAACCGFAGDIESRGAGDQILYICVRSTHTTMKCPTCLKEYGYLRMVGTPDADWVCRNCGAVTRLNEKEPGTYCIDLRVGVRTWAWFIESIGGESPSEYLTRFVLTSYAADVLKQDRKRRIEEDGRDITPVELSDELLKPS